MYENWRGPTPGLHVPRLSHYATPRAPVAPKIWELLRVAIGDCQCTRMSAFSVLSFARLLPIDRHAVDTLEVPQNRLYDPILLALLFGRLPFSRSRLSWDIWLRFPHIMSHGWPASAKTLHSLSRGDSRLFGIQTSNVHAFNDDTKAAKNDHDISSLYTMHTRQVTHSD